jgi:hypothetical protein
MPLSEDGGHPASRGEYVTSPNNCGPELTSVRHSDQSILCTTPLFGPLLFDNLNSDARDHCANERSTSLPCVQTLANPPPPAFLSYLRLSIYMAIVSVAIVISFHLKSEPTNLELRMARPLGIIFWLLSLSCLALGFGNYIQTVQKYSKRVAIVQTGWKTQSVSVRFYV